MPTCQPFQSFQHPLQELPDGGMEHFKIKKTLIVLLTPGSCAIISQVDATIIGFIGSFLANITANFLIYLKVDDAVGATCVHGNVSKTPTAPPPPTSCL